MAGRRAPFSWAPVAALGFVVLCGCGRQTGSPDLTAGLLTMRVAASEPVKTEEFNAAVASARRRGESWTDDPFQVAARFFQPPALPQVVMVLSGTGERPSAFRAIAVVDGLPDDSVRGRRHEATLSRTQAGFWQVLDAKMSWRCWRGRTDTFGVDPCP